MGLNRAHSLSQNNHIQISLSPTVCKASAPCSACPPCHHKHLVKGMPALHLALGMCVSLFLHPSHYWPLGAFVMPSQAPTIQRENISLLSFEMDFQGKECCASIFNIAVVKKDNVKTLLGKLACLADRSFWRVMSCWGCSVLGCEALQRKLGLWTNPLHVLICEPTGLYQTPKKPIYEC